MRNVAACVLVLCLLLCSVAAADPARDDAAAKQAFQRAEADFKSARYADALESYREAYRRALWPELIFNVAQCHHELGQKAQAVAAYRCFLQRWKEKRPGKPPPFEDRIRVYIKKHGSSAASQPASDQCLQVTTRPTTAPSPHPPEALQPSRLKRPWAWVAAGVGAVGIGVGVALLATRRVDEIVQEEAEGPLQQVTDSAVPGAMVLGVGVASAALSAYLFARTEQPVQVGVSVAPGETMAVVVGRF